MADFREQINAARRAGYSSAEIADYLKQSDPRVGEALAGGYSPDEVIDYLAPAPNLAERALRQTAIAARGATPAAAGAAAGALLGAPFGGPAGAAGGALLGSLAVPASDALISGYNWLTGSKAPTLTQVIQNRLAGPVPETTGERMVEAAGSALGGVAPQVAAGRVLAALPGAAGAIGAGVSRAPIGQLIAAPTSSAVGQGVAEKTDSPLAGLAAATATGGVMGVRPVKRERPLSAEELTASSKKAYDVLDTSGLQFDEAQFTSRMAALPAQLRKEASYTPEAYPKVNAAVKELTDPRPKDIAEIQALRKFIKAAQGSADPQERKIASILLDEFDDYVLNAPSSAIVSGDKAALQAWETAKRDYSRVKKSEVFTDMIEKASLSTTSKEQAMASRLSTLAKNDKRMRLFSPEEQDAIKGAARSGTAQRMLQVISKFAPMTPAAAIFTAVSPWGVGMAATGLAAKETSRMTRERQLNRLADQMRMGHVPQVISPFTAHVPFMAMRGGTEYADQNSLAP